MLPLLLLFFAGVSLFLLDATAAAAFATPGDRPRLLFCIVVTGCSAKVELPNESSRERRAEERLLPCPFVARRGDDLSGERDVGLLFVGVGLMILIDGNKYAMANMN